MDNVKKFNTIFDEFLTKLINHYKNLSDNPVKLNKYYKGFKLITMVDEKLPPLIFMSACFHLKQEIKTRNSVFFLNNEDILNTSKNYGVFSDQLDLNKRWDKLSEETKKSIWDYVQTLFILGEFIINENRTKFDSFLKNNSVDYKSEINNIEGGKFSKEFLDKLKK